MSVCLHECVYLFLCTHTCALMYVYISMNACVRFTCTHTCVLLRVCICISVYVCFPQRWIKDCLSPSQGPNPVVSIQRVCSKKAVSWKPCGGEGSDVV